MTDAPPVKIKTLTVVRCDYCGEHTHPDLIAALKHRAEPGIFTKCPWCCREFTREEFEASFSTVLVAVEDTSVPDPEKK
jgi:uncharacterized protein CbrC (UPF0167 family)